MRLSTKGSVRTARTGVLLDGTHRGARRREGPEEPPLLHRPLRCRKPLLHVDLLQPELDRPGDRALAAKHSLYEVARLEAEGVPDVLRKDHLALGADFLHADRHGLSYTLTSTGPPWPDRTRRPRETTRRGVKGYFPSCAAAVGCGVKVR